ncbi:unnamed protein product [Ilex paraguariensis]|uniref:NAC domain-containing protein n=1 Tax=Ilex paraguariensis TaxID=185542 RepID=A0ABC8SE76_9AQUA
MELESCVPPGFRFHPTEEELVAYYLKRKVDSLKIDLDVIIDLDLYRMEPWDIQGIDYKIPVQYIYCMAGQNRCKLGYDEQNEWYFFSHKDRKYPTGTRTNRATAAGFWKATGRDKAVLSKEKLVGMRKTLVFYKGRAPNGEKTDWIMHEYRLQTSEHAPPQASSSEEGWVVCRAFKKPSPNQKQGFNAWNYGYHIGNNSISRPPSFPDITKPMHASNQHTDFHHLPFGLEEDSESNHTSFDNLLVELPQLDSSMISTGLTNEKALNFYDMANEDHVDQRNRDAANQYSDWKNFDNLVALQMIEPASFQFPSLPLIPNSDEQDAKNHITHLLGCFPEL